MDYELSKKLKEAGFPKDYTQWDDHDEELLVQTWDMYGSGYSPTLEELIKACGKDFESLYTEGKFEWSASGWKGDPQFQESQVGSTPTEAVARLWLALRNKP